MQQRPTLADIADQAGVSTATVSRVLNGKSNVADVTRQQVLVALDLLGYERPESLRRSSRGLVGLVVPELSNPIFPAYAQQIEQLLAASGPPRCCAPRPPAAPARTSTSRCSSTAGCRESSSSPVVTPIPAVT